jgi:methionine synthase I (cobalamin-dependent)
MNSTTTIRPEGITDAHLEYLDDLRESGETNMFGARPYVQNKFDLDRDAAKKILMYWMESFGNPNR